MGLVVCADCANKLSDQAKACPECGCPTDALTGLPYAAAEGMTSTRRFQQLLPLSRRVWLGMLALIALLSTVFLYRSAFFSNSAHSPKTPASGAPSVQPLASNTPGAASEHEGGASATISPASGVAAPEVLTRRWGYTFSLPNGWRVVDMKPVGEMYMALYQKSGAAPEPSFSVFFEKVAPTEEVPFAIRKRVSVPFSGDAMFTSKDGGMQLLNAIGFKGRMPRQQDRDGHSVIIVYAVNPLAGVGAQFICEAPVDVMPQLEPEYMSILRSVREVAAATQQPDRLLASGFSVPNFTLSPDRRYGVTLPDLNHYIWPTRNDFIPQNSLVEVASGKVLSPITAFPAYVNGRSARMNRGGADAVRWSNDNSLLLWEVEGRWSPSALVLIKLKDNSAAWQMDLLALAQQTILQRTRSEAPILYNSVKARAENATRSAPPQSSDSYGVASSAYPDGFVVNVRTEGERETQDKGDPNPNSKSDPISLPLRVHAELFSNPKSIVGVPELNSQLDAVVSADGQFAVTKFELRKHPFPHAGSIAWADVTSGVTAAEHRYGDLVTLKGNIYCRKTRSGEAWYSLHLWDSFHVIESGGYPAEDAPREVRLLGFNPPTDFGVDRVTAGQLLEVRGPFEITGYLGHEESSEKGALTSKINTVKRLTPSPELTSQQGKATNRHPATRSQQMPTHERVYQGHAVASPR